MGAIQSVFKPPLIKQLETLRFEDCDLNWRSLAKVLDKAGEPHRLRSFGVSGNSFLLESARIFNTPLLTGRRELELSGCGLQEERLSHINVGRRFWWVLESLTLIESHPGH